MQKGAFWRAPNFIYRLDFIFGFPVYDKVVVKLVEWFQESDKDHPLSQELFLGYAPTYFYTGSWTLNILLQIGTKSCPDGICFI